MTGWRGKCGDVGQKIQSYIDARRICSGDLMYSMITTVKNTQYHTAYSKSAKKADLKCSHQKKQKQMVTLWGDGYVN